jgi:signal transduction histidine kinase
MSHEVVLGYEQVAERIADIRFDRSGGIQMNMEIYSSIENYLELAAESIIFALYSSCKLKTKKNKLLTIILWIVLAELVYFGAENITLSVALWLWIKGLLTQIYIFCFIQLAFVGSFKQKALNFVDILVTCWVIEIVMTGAVYLYHGSFSDLLDNTNFVLLYRLLSSILLSTAFSSRILVKNKENRKILIPIIIIQLLLVICEMIWSFEMYKFGVCYRINSHVIIYMLFNILAVFLNYSTVYIYDVVRRAAQREKELEYERKLKDNEYLYYQMALENENKIRNIRHEIGNQLQLIEALIDKDNKLPAVEIADSLKKAYDSVLQIDLSDNEIVNVILANKQKKALDSNVKLNINASGIPEVLKLQNIDLSIILSNLIDNAIEATARMEECQKTVTIKIVYNSNSLIIIVQNPTDFSDGDLTKTELKTSKDEQYKHGIGMSLVKKMVVKYKGKFTIIVENGMFITKVILFDV